MAAGGVQDEDDDVELDKAERVSEDDCRTHVTSGQRRGTDKINKKTYMHHVGSGNKRHVRRRGPD